MRTTIPKLHATRAMAQSGCGCDGCRLMARVYAGKVKRTPARPATFVDAAPFGEVIRTIQRSGMTLREIALFTGVGYSTMREVARGERERLHRDTAEALRTRLLQLLPSEVSA